MRVTVRTAIFVTVCLAMALAFANGQDHPNVPSLGIDRSVQTVDLSIHAEVDGQAHEPDPAGTSAKSPMSLRLSKPAARSVVWPRAAAVPDSASQGNKSSFISLSLQPTLQAPIAAGWPGLSTAAEAPAFDTSRHSKTLELHPKLFGALSAYVTNNSSAPLLGMSAVSPLSAPSYETQGLAVQFGRDQPAETIYSLFPGLTFSRDKGKIGKRKHTSPNRKTANSAAVVASTKSLATAKR